MISDFAVDEFRRELLNWYKSDQRTLPWRMSRDPYRVWISEVMLQQTQTLKVLEYYDAFLKRFPSLHDLAAAAQDDVLKAWEGLGYYARARNLHKAAHHIVQHRNAELPQTYAELCKIPGIGPYTAAAIASIVFGEPEAVVDGNVVRVLARLFLIREAPAERMVQEKLQRLATQLLDGAAPGDFNQAMMELGATICTPRRPACLLCPVSSHCRAFNNLDDPARLPVKKQKKPVPHHEIAVGLIWDEGYLFIDKRDENGLLGGLWEFPGGKIQPRESPQEALRREVREELALDVEVGDFFMQVRHAYTHFKITMFVYHCLYKGGEPELHAATDWRWIKPEELGLFAFPAANKKIIAKLESEFGRRRPRPRSA